jgi:hypothetical protein
MESPRSDLAWMALQVDALFESDAHGRLLRWRSPGSAEPPPRFFLGRTLHGQLWRFAAGLAPGLVRELARLAALERLDHPLDEPPERLEFLRRRLAEHAPIERSWAGPAFRFPASASAPTTEPADADADADGLVLLTPDRVALLGDELPALAATLAARQPCVAATEGGRVVSACYVATRSALAAEAGVETLPGFRGRGFATRAVAAWAAAVARAGLLPLYSTEWSNRASRALAQRLGLIRYGVDLHLR